MMQGRPDPAAERSVEVGSFRDPDSQVFVADARVHPVLLDLERSEHQSGDTRTLDEAHPSV